jgi:DNA modification methylase
VQSFSRENGLVIDPFCGSGSTCVAAALTGRRYLGIELEEKYCHIAEKRLAGATRFVQETIMQKAA